MMACERKLKRLKKKNPVQRCEWFLLCTNPATGHTPHPVLGAVPTCNRCHQFATGEARAV
jgi:hypothetical protein